MPFFEVTIRALGGLLGAHTLAPSPKLLQLAAGLGHTTRVSSRRACRTAPSHLQRGNASCPSSDFGESIPLSELGSVQLEFAELSRLTEILHSRKPRTGRSACGADRSQWHVPVAHPTARATPASARSASALARLVLRTAQAMAPVGWHKPRCGSSARRAAAGCASCSSFAPVAAPVRRCVGRGATARCCPARCSCALRTPSSTSPAFYRAC